MKIKNVVFGSMSVLALLANAGDRLINSGETLVFMGDSITQYGKERSHGYPHLVVKGLKANGIDVAWHGVGICGNTSADMIRRFDGDAMSKKPNVITISAGVNDVWFPSKGVTFEKFCQNEKAMIAKVKAAGAKAVLLSPTTALGEGPNDGIQQFAAGVKKIAAEEGLAYAPVFEMIRDWIDNPDTPALSLANGDSPLRATYDGVHMVPAGDRVLARATLTGLGLDIEELAKAEAAWNSDDTLVPLPSFRGSSSAVTVKLTDAEAKAVAGLSLKKVLDLGIPSLAADPKLEVEGEGATTEVKVSTQTGTFNYKAYDQLLLAARSLGIRLDEAIKCAVLRGARGGKVPEPTAPVAVVNDVLCGSTCATFDMMVKSVGATASACDVFLGIAAGDKSQVKECKLISIGENGTFDYPLQGLKPKTKYTYQLKFVNNATKQQDIVLNGTFTTKAASDAIEPSDDDDTAVIQAAIDAAVANKGTVTLSEGIFRLTDELKLSNGVSLVGQGYAKTTLKQTRGRRVVSMDGGSNLKDVTVTGGRLAANWKPGAGILVKDGMVSRCRVWHNGSTGRNVYGGGVFFEKGGILDSIIAENEVNYGCGGGIGWRAASGPFNIVKCQIYGNTVKHGKGGGIGLEMGNPEIVIRDTKITENTSSATGGGLFVDAMMKKVKLDNTVISGNHAGEGEADIAGNPKTR